MANYLLLFRVTMLLFYIMEKTKQGLIMFCGSRGTAISPAANLLILISSKDNLPN